jgi:hypothetical protein
MPPNALELSAHEPLEIIELDDRLDLAADPLFFADNGCCGNSNCVCPDNV